MTNAINKTYGDEKYFDFSTLKISETDTSAPLFRLTVGDIEKTISLTENQFGIADLSQVRLQDAIDAIQVQVNKETEFPATAKVKVGYDPVRQTFTFKTADDTPVAIRSANTANNYLFGLTSVGSNIDSSTGSWGAAVLPNGGYVLGESERRFGVEVKFDEVNNRFTISSGTTGDTSSIEISKASSMAFQLFGLQRGDTPTKVYLRYTTTRHHVSAGNLEGQHHRYQP